MADRSTAGPLSEWLELMLAEVARRQEEAQAARQEQSARAASGAHAASALPPQPQQPAHPAEPIEREGGVSPRHPQSRTAASRGSRRTRSA